MATTARLDLPRILDSDPAADLGDGLRGIVDILDNAALDDSGTLSARPAATSVPDGTLYFATDTAVAYRSDGSTWSVVGVRPAGTIAGSELEDEAVDTAQLADDAVTSAKMADAEKLGLSESGILRRGKSIVATEQARTNVAYGTLTTPDQVDDIVLPTDGLIFIAFQAMWKESVSGAARAAIHIGANQLKHAQVNTAAPSVQEVACGSGGGATADRYRPIATSAGGLVGVGTDGTAYTGDVSTGQLVGWQNGANPAQAGVCVVFAAAGTYDISVQFKSSSGSVTVKERKLWVWTQAF